MMSNVEKRKHKRVESRLPLKLKEGDFDFITETKNVSCSGAYCEVTRYLPPLTKIDVMLVFPKGEGETEAVSCKGIVVRTDHMPLSNGTNHYCIAIYFSDINKSDMSKLNQFVEVQTSHLN